MTENKVKYEYSLSDINTINIDEKINKITKLIENSQNIGSVYVFLKKALKKESDEDDPLKPTKSAFEITTELKVFFVYNKDRYLTDMLFEKGKEQIKKINPIEENSQDKEYVKNELSLFIHDSNTINGEKYGNGLRIELCHGLIFLEQNQNIVAVCRKPNIKISPEERYEETFENIEKFIADRKININSENTKRLFLISFSTKNNINSPWHAQLLVGNEKTFVINDQNKILFKLNNCNLFDSNHERLYEKSGQDKLLEFTFPSKTNKDYLKVISTTNSITENACAICVVGASRFFAKQHNEGKNLYESIILISSDINSIKELLTNIHGLRDIKEVTKGTGYNNFVSFNETTKNVDIEYGFIPFFYSNAGKVDENFYKITIEKPTYEEHEQIENKKIRNRLIKSFNEDEMQKSANKLAETINNINNNNIRNRRRHSII